MSQATETEVDRERAPDAAPARLSRARFGLGQFGAVWVALVLLVVLAAFFAPSAITPSSLLAMLPFAAILMIVAVGETLVIQQQGLDFSVGGAMALTIVIVTKLPNGDNDRLAVAIVVALVACLVAGLVSGIAIVVFNIPPLVATLGVNALLIGTAQAISGGSVTSATPELNRFMIDNFLGLPVSLWITLLILAVAAVIVRQTVGGRRFVASGANPRAARAAGVNTSLQRVVTYAGAAVLYSLAGIVYTGYLGTPDIYGGNQYLLAAISAVVIGGTALTGGRGSLLATAVACLFVQLLTQVVFALGAPTSTQYLVTAAVIAIAMVIRARRRA
jgi:ribose transport system permease protein